MMDPLTGKNRGYAFVTFCDKAHAAEASKKVFYALFIESSLIYINGASLKKKKSSRISPLNCYAEATGNSSE